MAVDFSPSKAYGKGTPLISIFPSPIISKRAPKTSDKKERGRDLIDVVAQKKYTLIDTVANSAKWKEYAFVGDASSFSTIVATTSVTSPLYTSAAILTLTAATSLDVNATGAVTIDSSAAGISLDGVLASNFTVTGAGVDLTLASTGGSVVIEGTEAIATAVTIEATDAAGGVGIGAGTGGVNIIATAGPIDLNSTTGLVTMTPATDTQAGAAVTINANVGVGIFTGLTTAAAADQVLTVTNSLCTVNSSIIATVSDLGTGDSQMFVRRVKPAAGSFTVDVTNGGAAALDADLKLTFWLIQA